VVVPDPRLVAGGGSGGLDPTGEPGSGQRAEHVVDRLCGDGVEAFPHPPGDLLHLQVATGGEHLKDGEARLGDPEAPRSQQLLACHSSITAHGWKANKAIIERAWPSPQPAVTGRRGVGPG